MIETERVVAEASRDDGSPGKRTVSLRLRQDRCKPAKIARKPIAEMNASFQGELYLS
jgi:hypothetical protein